mmetsp:Transcript_23666/g.54190  ORF Transcript_23666/g.54190 Transcript_23666/m.54190 type:complete len:414 (+) Transcript_23666:3-1244(+)
MMALLFLPAALTSSLPFPYNWSQFPAAWFGANDSSWEGRAQISALSQYSMAIFGWQALISATNWTASVYAQLAQAAVVKAEHPELPVFVYTGFGNANGYNAATWPLIKGASDGCPGHQPCRKVPEPYTDWFLETESVPVYSMSACEQMGMGYSNPPTDRCWNPIWNVANSSMRDYFIEHIIQPLAAAPMIDGVFFDCFNYAYSLPTPWNRRAVNVPNCTPAGGAGCEALLEGTIALARRVALALNARGKVPIFSNPASFTRSGEAIWLDEARLVAGLAGTQYLFNYEFMRAEKLAATGQLANMIREAQLGVPVGVHVYYKNATEDPTPHVAAFLLLRAESWYFFGSTGWLDTDWQWSAVYDTVSACGKPLGVAKGVPAPTVYARQYEGCNVLLNCTDVNNCVASISMLRHDSK